MRAIRTTDRGGTRHVSPYAPTELTPIDQDALGQVVITAGAVLSQRQMACLVPAGEISFLAVSSSFAMAWPTARLALWAVVC